MSTFFQDLQFALRQIVERLRIDGCVYPGAGCRGNTAVYSLPDQALLRCAAGAHAGSSW